VKGLIDAAVAGGDSDDVCAFVAKGWSYSDKDVSTLEAEFADTPDLDYREGEQMGSTSNVRVSSGDESWTFTVEADSDSNWTVSNFGSLNPAP